MDDGGEKGQNITASTSAPSHKRVSFTPQIKVVNSDQGSGRRPDLDTNLKGIEHGSDKTSESHDSDSSSDDDDHFTPQLLPELEEENDVPQSIPDTELSNPDTELSFKIDKLDVSSECSSSSRHSDIVRVPILPDNSTMVSPPIQVMERCRQGSDQDVLHSASSPSSTPKAPLGWSTTSNDSLFSIRIGDNSFCRDYATKMDVDLSKSEGVSGELFQFGYSSELPKVEEPHRSRAGELYKESFKVSDVTIRGELVSCREASSASKEGEFMYPGETGMEYVPLNHTPDALVGTSSKKASASTPTVKGGTEAQTTTDPKKKSSFCPLCYPGFCQGLCFCKITFNCCCVCAWPSCSGNCFSLKSCCSCCQCSASSWKSFTCPSCSRSCCCPGSSWSCKCFTCSGCWPKGCCSGCPSLKCAWKCC